MPSYLTPQHHGILSSKTDGLLQPISGGGNGRSCAGNSRLRTGLFLPAPQPRAFGQHFRGGYFEECGLSAQSIFSAHPRSDAGSSCADTASESPSGFGQLRSALLSQGPPECLRTQSRARGPTLRATLIFSAGTKRNRHPSGPQYPDPMAPARPRLCFFQGNRFKGGKHRMGRNLYFQTFLAERVCVLALD